MPTTLVTGGAGFIGSHLTDALLAAGHQVRVLDDLSTGHRHNVDPRAQLIVGDICEADTVAQALDGADECFHLAAIASVARGNEDWAGTHRVNLTGSITVLDACRARHLPVVYASSAAVYGDVGDSGCVMRRSHPHRVPPMAPTNTGPNCTRPSAGACTGCRVLGCGFSTCTAHGRTLVHLTAA